VSEWNSGYFNGENGEWNSGQFSGEKVEWLSEQIPGKNIGYRRKRRRTLRYGDCVLTADSFRVIVCRQQFVLWYLCVDSRLC
jgi:hypothetical protein